MLLSQIKKHIELEQMILDDDRILFKNDGRKKVKLMFVIDSPLREEAKQLLNKMILAMGLKQEDVCVADILETNSVLPKIICILGQAAMQSFLKNSEEMSRVHGKFFYYDQIPVIPTFHPDELLQNENMKKLAWQDLQVIMRIVCSPS